MKAAVVGGGIAGLSAAWELACRGAQVTVYEPGHLGGKLLTTDFLGRPVDEGPDALLARVPEGTALCRELGLGDELVAPAASRAMLWSGGRLRALPEGLVLGAPARLGPLARSGILSISGMARALGDLVLPRRPVGDDASVFDLVADRFGREVADKLIEPLVGSIYAGTTRGLSAATTAPQLLRAAKHGRSLMFGLRAASAQRPGRARPQGAAEPGPMFQAPLSGMGAIADALVDQLTRDRGARLVRSAVTSVRAAPAGAGRRAGGLVVATAQGEETYDGAVLATPAPSARRLLEGLVPGAQGLGHLATIRLSSVAIVTLAFPERSFDVPAGLSGVLVGAGDHLLMTACSFGSHKWPHWVGPGTTILRVSVGKVDDERWTALEDAELVRRCCTELATVLPPGKARLGSAASSPGQPAAPLPDGARVSRWPAALPQYPVGHLQAMATLRAELAAVAPTLALAGASCGRVGVPANIAAGREAGAAIFTAASSLAALG